MRVRNANSLRENAVRDDARVLPLRQDRKDAAAQAGPPGLLSATRDALAWLPSGARVLTRQGETPVEQLAAGQLVMCLGTGPHWRGVVRVETRTVPHQAREAAPVLVRQGALIKGAPIRDMRVAPGATLVIDGVAAPAALLVNDSSILREAPAEDFAYHGIYLEAPGQLIVDGALVESGPGGDPGPDAPPRQMEGPALEALRERIGEIAHSLPQQ